MPHNFENQKATKLKDETVSDSTAEKLTDHVAERAAEKTSKTEQLNEKDHPIFSK